MNDARAREIQNLIDYREIYGEFNAWICFWGRLGLWHTGQLCLSNLKSQKDERNKMAQDWDHNCPGYSCRYVGCRNSLNPPCKCFGYNRTTHDESCKVAKRLRREKGTDNATTDTVSKDTGETNPSRSDENGS